jgi:hypothetical protein
MVGNELCACQSRQGATVDKCPYDFNFDPATFKFGDLVSYRVPERFDDFPFVGTIIAVHEDYIELTHDGATGPIMRGTRTSRPVVSAAEALAEN